MIAAKHFDQIIGVDFHFNIPPASPPVLVPHPYSGMVWDPIDYLPYVGQTIHVNGFRAAQPMTEIKYIPPHFPMVGPFQMIPESKGEVFTGSSSVGGTVMEPGMVFPLARLADISLGCSDVGNPAPVSPDKKGGVKKLTINLGMVLAAPKGMPVLVGGFPMPAPLSAFAMRFAMKWGLGKLMKVLGKGLKAVGKALNRGVFKKLGKKSKFFRAVSKKMCNMGLDPIDLATGVMVTEREDFSLPGPIPLIWESTYYSSSTYKGPIGYGWHHNYDISLSPEVVDGLEVIEVRTKEGRTIFCPTLDVGGSFFNRQEKLELGRDTEGYFLKDSTGLAHRFHEDFGENWPLARIEDQLGNSIQFEYDERQHLSKITDSARRELPVGTDAQGQILSIHAPHPVHEGKTFSIVRYEYDANGNLIAAKDALNQVFKYNYENHLMVELTYRNGLSFYYKYDGTDHTARCIHSHGDGGLHSGDIFYEEGKTILEHHIGLPDGTVEKRTEIIFHDGAVALREIDPLGNEKTFEYSDDYELLAETDALGQRTEYQYDDRGNRIATLYPDGTVLKMTYNEADMLVYATDQMGGKWQWVYNDRNQLVKRLDPLQRTTVYHYNEAGQLISILDPAGGKTLLGYNEVGSIDQLTTPDNAASRWKYDRLGRSTQSIDPKGNVQRRTFDLLGQVTAVQEPDGNRRKLKYDPMGNVTYAKDKHHEVEFKYQGLGRLKERVENKTRVEFQYDTEERLINIVNEHGSVYHFDLDANGDVEIESGFDEVKRYYKRNAAGQVTTVMRASGLTSNYEYDAMGRVKTVRHSNGEGESYVYRADGDLMEAHNRAGSVLFERDELGRVISENQNGISVHSEYDALGMRTRLRSSLGVDMGISRNNMGDAMGMKAEMSILPWEIQFKRDIVGLEVERLLPGGVVGKWDRDKLGRPTHHKVFGGGGKVERSREYVWDVNSRLKRFVDFGKEVTQFEHDGVGNLSATIYPDQKKEYRTPDAVGNLFRDPNQKDRKYGKAGQLLEAKGTIYDYDPEGNLIKKWTPDGKEWQYIWNASGMLEKVVRPDGEAVTFTYDALGRRLTKTYKGETTHWVWDGNVPLHEWKSTGGEKPPSPPPPSEPERYSTLDPMLEDKPGFSDDDIVITEVGEAPPPRPVPPPPADDSFIVIEEVGTETAVAKAAEPARTLAMPDPTAVVTWLFEPESFSPIAKLVNDKQYSIQTDHLGTPVSMYDEKGERVWAADISSYGDLRNLQGARDACPFRFPGQYEDVETGLYYNRFRYYDAEGGFYVSQDPIRLLGGIKLHSFVNDPNSWSDPLGLAGNPIIIIGGPQKRVNQVAEQLRKEGLSVKTITDDWPADKIFTPYIPEKHEAISIEYNREWINKQMDSGAEIYDIGRKGGHSKWYQAEHEEIFKRSYDKHFGYNPTTGQKTKLKLKCPK